MQLLSWLKVMQKDIVLSDDDLVRELVGMGSFHSFPQLHTIMDGKSPVSSTHSSTHGSHLINGNHQARVESPSLETSISKMDELQTIVSPQRVNAKHTEDMITNKKDTSTLSIKSDSAISSNAINGVRTSSPVKKILDEPVNYFTPPNQPIGETIIVAEVEKPSTAEVPMISEEEQQRIDQKRGWSGTCLDDFKFVDTMEKTKGMSYDCSYSNNYKVRGINYMADKKKVEAGPAIAKFILLELYEVNKKNFPNGRHDHISQYGKVKERIKVIANLPEKPFVFIVNMQLPGDPQVCSFVGYFEFILMISYF